ncbi:MULTISPECIES: peptidylprolyl isomerase [Tenacibaculum]|uniref:peptidylprolyl isomerase n=1 Tax=Tenacibaculum TaxID=104267 RepID=UPI001F0AD408|nr:MULTISPECIES: peptidylprolyl isomerase [Tenacibaculum]MCH3883183.1 peptidylprolyl isomerase [Tenacibaculum aquimarinum]MDO6600972.1 peptidylprolyl isomerase [Tenacibaculum sp. 1_MG-2023]
MKYLKLILVFAVLFSACKAAKYPNLENGLYADIQTNKGDILLKLYGEEVPMTVANFISLAEGDNPNLADSLKGKKFYDGLKFHRVINNFMIQGGDPLGNGTGNAGYKFADEFPSDSIGDLIYKHDKKGVLSMANGGPNSNSSQFFITHKDTPWLDRKHSVFGQVELGLDVVDSIRKDDVINTIDIIRVGKFAKKFEAPEVFKTELANVETKAKEYQEKLAKLKEAYLKERGIDKAIKTTSGLKILELKKGTGKKFNRAIPATMHYTVTLANGKLIQSTEGKEPFGFTLDKQPMIGGVTEAILEMREGDKKRLFIPYYLGYGEKLYGPFPAKSDIVFDLELIKVGK